MYCLSKHIHPPTVVEHSIHCNFYNDEELNLVVGGGNQIKVYRLVSKLIDLSDKSNENHKNNVKLECLQSFNFSGEITSIGFVRLNKNIRDSILITFMDAKISIVEYDPFLHNLKTLSMNYFEDEEYKQGYIRNIYQPVVRSDPDNRCCAMFNYGKNIVIIPFKSESVNEEHVDQLQGLHDSKPFAKSNLYSYVYPTFKNTILPAYKLDLQDKNYSGEKINNIIDIQFLEGYYEPTLLILYEPIRTWAGRIAVRQDTCAMIALSLNVHQKVHPIIWSTNNLPFDSLYVIPVPRPIGGVLIFCTNILIYLNQSVPPYAVTLNSFADSSSSFPATPQKNLKISLDCSKACFLSNDKLVICLKGGEIFVVTLFIDRMRCVKKFHFEKAASSIISSCVTFCGKEYLFIGSRLGNSLLLKYTEKVVNIIPKAFEDNSKTNFLIKNEEEPIVFLNENIKQEKDLEDNTLTDIKEIEDVFDDKSNVVNGSNGIEVKENSDPFKNDVSSFLNLNLDENNLYKENDFIIKEEPVENYKKRKVDEIEFDEEDKELYGDTDPIFQETKDEILSPQINKNIENITVKEDKKDSFIYEEENLDTKSNIPKFENLNLNNTEKNITELDLKDQELEDLRNKKNEEENLKNLLNDNDDLQPDQNCFDLVNEINQTSKIYEENEFFPSKNETPNFENGIGNWMAGDVALLKDSEELEIFGPQENEEKLPVTLVFEVCDSIINIGPCARFCMGELSFLAEELEKENDPQIELVTTSGYGKNGAICVLQRSIRPQVVTTFVLPSCIDMWTVYSSKNESIEKSSNDDNHHAFLILSRSDSTMILQTGQEINELDQNGFINNSKTVFAGNLCNNKYIIQISPNSIRLIEGTKQIKNLPLELGSPIISASLADPHCIVITESGIIIHLHLSFEANAPKLTLVKLDFPEKKAKITSAALFEDSSGLFLTKINRENEIKKEIVEQVEKVSKLVCNEQEIDDLDELLYGDSDVNAIVGASIVNEKKIEENNDNSDDEINSKIFIKTLEKSPSTFWLFVTRDDGCLEIYSMPDIVLVYHVEDFGLAPLILADCDDTNRKQINPDFLLQINEIFIGGFGVNNSKPLLFVRFDQEICVYETFQYVETEIENHLKIRFSKLNNTMILNELNEETNIKHKKYFRPFSDISGYFGLFVCGQIPHWFFMSDRGELRLHEMSIDGRVVTFSSFHNVNCPKGFLYFNDKDELRIAVLPTHITYDAPWPVRKVATKCTVHFVKYHVINKCYVVVTSIPQEYKKVVKVGGEDKDFEFLERDDRYIWPTTEKFSIQLFSPVSWEMIPGTKIDLDDWEHVTCLQNVMLQTEGTETGFKGFVALGTNYCYGEDVTNKGRIMILDIVEVVPEPGQPLTKNKIKVVYSKEQKGPVTALTQVKGYLLSSIGQKIYIWQLKEDQLAGVAFIDTQIYIHSAVSIKNLILVADIYKSISLLRYQEETKTLALVSKDIRSFEVYGCEFMVDNNLLCFIVSDADKNIILYHYQPEVRESNGGTRLIQRADYHIGATINHFFRIRCKNYKSYNEEKNKANTTRQITMFATLDGSLGFILPISEKIYRRLLMVQNLMNNFSPNLAGLNPKAFRLYKTSSKTLLNPCKNVLDGDLLSKFINLSSKEKYELAKKIGTTTQQIRKDLFEIDRITAHF